jgi:hypothetical protein
MTPEQRLDRLERLARLPYEAVVRDSRECRKRDLKLRAYWAALDEYFAAKREIAEKPEEHATTERLRLAKDAKDEAWRNLEREVDSRPTRLPKRNQR